MAKIAKPKKYDEGAIKGKKVFLLGALPIFIFLIIAGGSAYTISTFTNKLSVNENDDVCNKVRRQYASSIQSGWPCDVSDEGSYLLVTFNQSINTGSAAALMTFKYDKDTKLVTPALSAK
jgi:hypothetical protein